MDNTNSEYGTIRIGEITGNTVTFGNEIVFNSGYTDYISIQSDPFNQNKFIVGYRDDSNSNYGTIRIYRRYINSNIIGTLQQNGVSGDTKKVLLLGGLDETRTGLTINSKYYINNDGQLSTISGETSTLIGKALSPTTLLTKNIITYESNTFILDKTSA
jgi:hypothetical protein